MTMIAIILKNFYLASLYAFCKEGLRDMQVNRLSERVVSLLLKLFPLLMMVLSVFSQSV